MQSYSFIYNRVYFYSKEKRRYRRVPLNYNVEYPLINFKPIRDLIVNGKYLQVIDISEGGMGIKSNLLLKENDFISFQLRLPNADYSFECIACIRNCRYEDDCSIYGVEFVKLDLRYMKLIREYVDETYCELIKKYGESVFSQKA
ncbi:PilZ domain-containing protein [Clostridium thermarum]|uniref:PilZ domain-containing protein n=1 Tax=Clostridium thermarum TaxID=1716543 RepID=UPI0013D34BAA|nr:PilZ domain-containing protein [Clostridium thermarum]